MNITGYNNPPSMPHTTYSHSCTLNSFNSTSMLLKDYTIRAGSIDSAKIASFKVYNPATLDTYDLASMPVQDDGAWHPCVRGEVVLPWQLVSCQYILDRQTSFIGFRFQWFCDDRDPLHALVALSYSVKDRDSPILISR